MRADLADWIALNMIRGVGPRTANELLERFGSPAQVFSASRLALEKSGLKPETIQELRDSSILDKANAEIERLETLGAEVITLEDENYPELLREIHDRMPVIIPKHAYDRWLCCIEPDPRDLLVPSEWINGRAGELHRDFGMAIVSPNSQGNLTDVVGGAGWAYNQPTNSTFYPYGYPAAPPFDGQSRISCSGSAGKSWQHAGGLVISVTCNMTGGSSGGPWFISISNKLYLNGHNDFRSSIQPDHMFSPYYDDTWFALYDKAQNT